MSTIKPVICKVDERWLVLRRAYGYGLAEHTVTSYASWTAAMKSLSSQSASGGNGIIERGRDEYLDPINYYGCPHRGNIVL